MSRWLFEAVPLGRVAALRTVAYLFIVFDLLVYSSWVRARGEVPAELYQPLAVARFLHLPPPAGLLVDLVWWALLLLAPLAATGRLPRLLGWAVFALYLEWLIIAMSYGKVDHDRFAFLVALAVLPTVGAARHGDRCRSEAAGWALRVVQIAVVCTYFLSAYAKIRFGGWGWLTGSVLARAFLRRGSEFADLLAAVPYALIAAQIGIVVFEAASPLVFLTRGRLRYAVIGFFYSFHLMSFATISISFAPHLVAMGAFLPLERVRPLLWARRAPAPDNVPMSGDGQRPRGTFVYDGDCAFCTMCVRFIERRVPHRAEVVPWQWSDLGVLGLTREQALAAVQWVPAGAVGSAGAGPVAIAALLRTSNPFWRAVGAVLALPPVTALAWPVYRWIADNRHRLPGGTAACAVPREPAGPDHR
ncbi:DCC1-like thiol-disulfide oxidoreductase family protein [Solwaraspora sp. WMMB335]|uniref:DCC1-like thiol-disulfide oxidoreductase family protein n=1 Tax=Solwaraspora sp. WMMB335 TaxID=3404118 RepID=UPI003B933257